MASNSSGNSVTGNNIVASCQPAWDDGSTNTWKGNFWGKASASPWAIAPGSSSDSSPAATMLAPAPAAVPPFAPPPFSGPADRATVIQDQQVWQDARTVNRAMIVRTCSSTGSSVRCAACPRVRSVSETPPHRNSAPATDGGRTRRLSISTLALEDEDARVFLLALRDVADARGGVRSLSRDAHLNRESLYRMLSKSGNPSLASLAAVLNAWGLRLAVQSTAPRRRKRRIA